MTDGYEDHFTKKKKNTNPSAFLPPRATGLETIECHSFQLRTLAKIRNVDPVQGSHYHYEAKLRCGSVKRQSSASVRVDSTITLRSV